MKQYISIEQLNELSEKGKERLRNWWKPEMGDLYIDDYCLMVINCCEDEVGGKERQGYENVVPLPSIGQMIEYLENKYEYTFALHIMRRHVDWKIVDETDGYFGKEIYAKGINIRDALWEAVKSDLEK